MLRNDTDRRLANGVLSCKILHHSGSHSGPLNLRSNDTNSQGERSWEQVQRSRGRKSIMSVRLATYDFHLRGCGDIHCSTIVLSVHVQCSTAMWESARETRCMSFTSRAAAFSSKLGIEACLIRATLVLAATRFTRMFSSISRLYSIAHHKLFRMRLNICATSSSRWSLRWWYMNLFQNKESFLNVDLHYRRQRVIPVVLTQAQLLKKIFYLSITGDSHPYRSKSGGQLSLIVNTVYRYADLKGEKTVVLR